MIERAHPIVDHLASPMLAAFLHQIHGFLAYQQEAYPLAERELQTALAMAEQDRHMGLGMIMFYPGLLGLVQATIGKREEARASMASVEVHLDRLPEGILPTAPLLICLTLSALALGDHECATRFYPALLTFSGQHYWRREALQAGACALRGVGHVHFGVLCASSVTHPCPSGS